jgi:predicted secreted hydrolase
MRTIMAAVLYALAMAANAHAAIKEEPVTYQAGTTTMKGFVVYDDAVQGKRPGIVMVHEWWSVTKHIHCKAQKFAQIFLVSRRADPLAGSLRAGPDRSLGWRTTPQWLSAGAVGEGRFLCC